MRVIVTGGLRTPVLFDSKDKATGVVICDNAGNPNTLYAFSSDGAGWTRYTKGEDKEFAAMLDNSGFAVKN